MAAKCYWLKERHNPQFNQPYYVPLGQMTAREAKKYENTLYGTNYLHKFKTKDEYEKRITKLRAMGCDVRDV